MILHNIFIACKNGALIFAIAGGDLNAALVTLMTSVTTTKQTWKLFWGQNVSTLIQGYPYVLIKETVCKCILYKMATKLLTEKFLFYTVYINTITTPYWYGW